MADHLSILLRRNRWRRAGAWVTTPWWITKRHAALCYHGRGLAEDLEESAPFSTAYAWAHRLHCDIHDKFMSTRRYWRFHGPGLSAAHREIDTLSRLVPF